MRSLTRLAEKNLGQVVPLSQSKPVAPDRGLTANVNPSLFLFSLPRYKRAAVTSKNYWSSVS
jgi:hypothetical protein